MDNFVNIVIDSKINSYQVNHLNAVSCQRQTVLLLSGSANGWIVKVAENSFYLIEIALSLFTGHVNIILYHKEICSQ